MKINVVNRSDTDLYLLQVLQDIKLTFGNVALNSTLMKHKELREYLRSMYEKDLLAIEDSLGYTNSRGNL